MLVKDEKGRRIDRDENRAWYLDTGEACLTKPTHGRKVVIKATAGLNAFEVPHEVRSTIFGGGMGGW